MENNDKTTEPQLRDYERAGVISAAKIVKTPDGYVLVIRVSWKPGDLIVFNLRGKPRTWMSMDRLLAYLAEVTPSIRQLELQLDQPPDWPQSAKLPDKKQVASRVKST